MKTPAMSAPGRAGRGAVDQKFVKYLGESSNFVKKTPILFSFEILGNEMRDSQLCREYTVRSDVEERVAEERLAWTDKNIPAWPKNISVLWNFDPLHSALNDIRTR